MVGELYVLVITILLLFALAITLPVIRDIVFEGLERRRQWDSEKTDTTATDTTTALPDAETTTRDCPHCGATNDADYEFCQQCSEPL